MNIITTDFKTILSYLGGYFNSNEFDLDISKISDISELTEEEIIDNINKLQASGDISYFNNKVTLKTIIPVENKQFNEEYKPIETVVWEKHSMIKLDK